MSLLEIAQGAGALQYTEVSCVVTAGPERAAALGVPVGTVVEVAVTREYTSPAKQRWWDRLHPGGIRFRPSEGQVI